MCKVDVEQFWKDNDIAMRDNCFNSDAAQVAMGIRMSAECVFDELGEEGKPWGNNPPELMRQFCRRYNDKAERIVGRRLLSEDYPSNQEKFPPVKLIGEVFGGRYIYKDGIYWLESDLKTPRDLEQILDRADAVDIRSFILPPDWENAKRKIFETSGETLGLLPYGRRVRGPVTLATSICGIENTIFWMYDSPELMHRLFDCIEKVILRYIAVVNEEAGKEKVKFQHKTIGFRFYDDNCCLLTPELYEEFAYPVLRNVFAQVCPDPDDYRYQHSDSAMEHLLPILGRLNFTAVNFGPTVLADKIREYMPRTRIDGCLDPLVFMSNDEDAIRRQVKRDCEMSKNLGFRGLCLNAAGSISNGTRLTSMLAVMRAIQTYGRF
jgi:uroporphyrinogen decarboxylase